MSERDAEIVKLLEEIRDNQRTQIEQQRQALERVAERIGSAEAIRARTDKVFARTEGILGGARILLWIFAPFAVLLVAALLWFSLARFLA
jgi:hypothetical protein